MGQTEYEYMNEQTGKRLMLPCFFECSFVFWNAFSGFPGVL